MAVRVNTTSATAYQDFQRLVRMLKAELVGDSGNGGWSVRLASDDVPWVEFVRMMSMINSSINAMDAIAATTGIRQYVRDQEQDQAYDIVAEYNALHASLVAIRDWIFTNMPKVTQGGSSYLVVTVLMPDGTLIDRLFTPTQTAGLRAAITTFKNTVM